MKFDEKQQELMKRLGKPREAWGSLGKPREASGGLGKPWGASGPNDPPYSKGSFKVRNQRKSTKIDTKLKKIHRKFTKIDKN